eukprot:6491777-Amphidinium_carterae.2
MKLFKKLGKNQDKCVFWTDLPVCPHFCPIFRTISFLGIWGALAGRGVRNPLLQTVIDMEGVAAAAYSLAAVAATPAEQREPWASMGNT